MALHLSVSGMQWKFACRPFSFLLCLIAAPLLFLSFWHCKLAFLDALPSDAWFARHGCGYCCVMAVLKPAGHPVWLLSELTAVSALGGKGGRSCAPTRLASSLAIHLTRMARTASFGVSSVADAQTGLLNN